MPELPEVETIKRGLAEHVVGQKITGVKRKWAKTLQDGGRHPAVPATPAQIKKHVIGAKVTGLRRRGKVLIIDLDNGYSLLFHLKMTGQIVFESDNSKTALRAKGEGLSQRFAGGHPTKSLESKLPDRSTRIIFELNDGSKLFFNDQRKFGWIKLVSTREADKDKLLARLGPEPLEAAFDVSEFIAAVKRRKAPIKAVLLDQNTVAGVGNIYADEALHKAKIHPATRANEVSKAKLAKLHQAVVDVIEDSLKYGGTTFTNYVNHLGKKGDYLKHARVFRRQGEPCPVCGTTIEKIRVAGRGTHICPKCQRISK